MSSTAPASPGASDEPSIPFTPVPVRARHDGWTPGMQILFIQALADTANVAKACRRIGMSQQSAYALRGRPDAVSFRQAWAIAIDHGSTRLADKAMARAMEGVVVPIFYKGEKVGERRVFNERLTQFLLRAHLPERYGAWRDTMMMTREHPDGLAVLLQQAIRAVAEDAIADRDGKPRPRRALIEVNTRPRDDEDKEDAVYEAMRERFRTTIDAQEQENEALRRQLREVSGAEGGSTLPISKDGSGVA